jgi:hypothetical protein
MDELIVGADVTAFGCAVGGYRIEALFDSGLVLSELKRCSIVEHLIATFEAFHWEEEVHFI